VDTATAGGQKMAEKILVTIKELTATAGGQKMAEKILVTIKELRERTKKRNFSQSFNLIVNLKEFNVKKPENRISAEISLPYKPKESEIVIFTDSIKDVPCKIMKSKEIEELAKNRREIKKLIGRTDFFLAEAKLMPLIGKLLGQLLAPRGLMPKIVTPENVNPIIGKLKKSIRIKVRDAPVVQCWIGNEEMGDEEITENIKTFLKFLETKLPKGKHNISEVLLKLTMSKPVKIEV